MRPEDLKHCCRCDGGAVLGSPDPCEDRCLGNYCTPCAEAFAGLSYEARLELGSTDCRVRSVPVLTSDVEPRGRRCRTCGRRLPATTGAGAPRRYCSDRCRGRWYRLAAAARRKG